MKPGLLFLFVFILAPDIFSQEFNGGIYSGLVASQLDGDTYRGYNKAGIIGGAFVNRFFTNSWAGQLGLHYIQKGSKRNDTKNGIYYKSQLHYIELPVTVRYFYFKKIDFEAGCSFGYLIKALEDKDGYGLVEADPAFNKFEICSIGGINYQVNKSFTISLHASYSLTPARAYSSGYERFMDKGQHNNITYLTLNYSFTSWK